MKRIIQFLWLIILIFSYSQLSLAQLVTNSSGVTESSDKVSLHALIIKYLGFYEKKDLKSMVSMWSPQSAVLTSRRQIWQQMFTIESYSYQFSQPQFPNDVIEGNRATLSVIVKCTTIDMRDNQIRNIEIQVEYSFVKEQGKWMFWNETPAILGLFGNLVSARTDAERESWLEKLPSLVLHELLIDLNRESDSAFNAADYDRALKLSLAARVVAERLGEPLEIAQTFDNIGKIHFQSGNYILASEFYQKSIKWLEASQKSSGNTNVVNQLLKIAKLEYEQENDVKAANFFERAIAHLDEMEGRESYSSILSKIADIYYMQGNYAQALNYYLKGAKSSKDAGNLSSEIVALQGLGVVYTINGNYSRALEVYQRNLDIAQLLSDRAEKATALARVGRSHFLLGNYGLALGSFQEVLAIREELKNAKDIADVKFDVAATLAAQKEFAKAIEEYYLSRKLYESVGYLSEAAATLLNTGEIYFAQNEFAKTLEIVDQVESIARRGGDQNLFWQARYLAGRAYYRLNNLVEARQALTEAMKTIETMRTPSEGRLSTSFDDSQVAPYLAMVNVAVRQGQSVEAFNFAERVKASILAGILRNSKVRINKTLTPPECDREGQLNVDLTRLTTQIAREQGKTHPDQDRINNLTERLKNARTEYAALLKSLYARHPQLKVIRGEAKPLNAQQALRVAPNVKTAILSFVETEEQTYLFVLTRSQGFSGKQNRPPQGGQLRPQLRVYALGVSRSTLYPQVSNLRQLIATKDARVESQSRHLYDLLLKPAHEELRGVDNLIIIPDGILWNLPFQALRTDNDHYLIETKAVSLTPSLTALHAISKLAEAQRHANQPLSLLAFGNPSPNLQAMERMKAMQLTEHPEPTNHTQIEVDTLGQLYGSERSAIYTGADASRTSFRNEAGKYRVIHFATRGVLSEAAPFFSAVALSAPKESKEDGTLELRDFLELDLKSSLIVLSASEESSQQLGLGRNLMSATWAFYIAGCPTSLIARWYIDSPSTASLMSNFHQTLKAWGGNQKSKAWRSVVKQWLKRKEFSHPYFWAGFEMLGDGQ